MARTPFQCPEGLIVYFTNTLSLLNRLLGNVSMPRRAHCVFHHGEWKSIQILYQNSFNALKGSLCISPKSFFVLAPLLSMFQCPVWLFVYFTD